MTTKDQVQNGKAVVQEQSIFREAVDLICLSLGIYACFLGYGLVQERIYGGDYGGERFSHSLFLVWVQCLVNGSLAFAVCLYQGKVSDDVPQSKYIQIAFSYIGAMYASNWALAFVNYPTQALAKSCKLIPVMLMRIVINGKRYQMREYVCVLLITAGITVFQLGKGTKAGGNENSLFGLGLLLLSLVLDGLTGPTQEKMIAEFKPTIHQLMFRMNLFAVLMVAVALLATGQGVEAVAFVEAHPEVAPQMLGFALLSAVGQNFILMTLFRFDSLVLTTVTTTRKFFTILCSVLYYGHVLNTTQWGGVSMVFAGLGMDTFFKYQNKQARLNTAAKKSN